MKTPVYMKEGALLDAMHDNTAQIRKLLKDHKEAFGLPISNFDDAINAGYLIIQEEGSAKYSGNLLARKKKERRKAEKIFKKLFVEKEK